MVRGVHRQPILAWDKALAFARTRTLLLAIAANAAACGAAGAGIWDQCAAMPVCVARVSQMVAQVRAAHLACIPGNLSDQQAVMVVSNFAQRHPEAANMRAATLARIALVRSFPCRR